MAPTLSRESVTAADAVRQFERHLQSAAPQGGVLERASTRRDGERGEEVRANIRTVRSVPRRLHWRGVPRLNSLRGEKAAAGSLRLLEQMARRAGVPLVISTDAHRIPELEFMRDGVDQARRVWCRTADVANTRPLASFGKLLAK